MAFAEEHHLALGSGGDSLPLASHRLAQGADCILGIACGLHARGSGIILPARRTIIHSTHNPSDLHPCRPRDDALVGHAALTLDALLDAIRERLGNRPRGRKDQVAASIAATREEWLRQWLPKLTSDQVPMTPYRVIWDLLHTVDVANTIVTHD